MKILHSIEDQYLLNSNENKVTAIGNFDGLHSGHLKILQTTCTIANNLKLKAIGITFDPHPKIFHTNEKNFLLNTKEEKIQLISKKTNLDYLLFLQFDEKLKSFKPENFIQNILINKLKSQYIVVGNNFYFGLNKSGNIDLLKQFFGKNLITLDLVNTKHIEKENITCSSTRIKELIRQGDVLKASYCLGYYYSISGNVINGRKEARKFNFPTANIVIPDEKIIPKFGTYAIHIELDNKKYDGVGYISKRDDQNLLEAHILDWKGNLYGKTLKVEFIKFISEPQIFFGAGWEKQLKEKVALDVSKTREFFEDFNK
jgi:riboflavin kinase/FMN adenylyltransferase